MKASLQFRLSPQLALTPQLQQSIRLLQLSTLELNQEIEQALADNPLLERDDDPLAAALRIAGDGAIDWRTGASAAASADADAGPGAAGAGEATAGEPGGGESAPLLWEGAGAPRDSEDDGPAAWAAARIGLHQHLRDQLATTRAAPRDRALVELLIDAVNENGYLGASLEELLALCPPEAQVDADELRTALRLLQSFDPTGVGARDPAECLALQIDERLRGGADPAQRELLTLARRLVAGHLPALAARDFVRLRRELGVDDGQLRAAQQIVHGLDPRPGVGFAPTDVDYVVPDVIVRRVRNQWIAELNADAMPRLRLNQDYAAVVKRTMRGTEAQAAWSGRVQEARWLVRNIQQRFDTIIRVASAIVDRQQSFFSHGAIAMRPLVLREIAETVGLHESTISRVTTQKYLATPFGVLEMKYFFCSHVATESGGAASSTAIRALIKQLIGAENPSNPLSDSHLADLLGGQGIVVARRTVAKYREALRIPPVAQRRAL